MTTRATLFVACLGFMLCLAPAPAAEPAADSRIPERLAQAFRAIPCDDGVSVSFVLRRHSPIRVSSTASPNGWIPTEHHCTGTQALYPDGCVLVEYRSLVEARSLGTNPPIFTKTIAFDALSPSWFITGRRDESKATAEPWITHVSSAYVQMEADMWAWPLGLVSTWREGGYYCREFHDGHDIVTTEPKQYDNPSAKWTHLEDQDDGSTEFDVVLTLADDIPKRGYSFQVNPQGLLTSTTMTVPVEDDFPGSVYVWRWDYDDQRPPTQSSDAIPVKCSYWQFNVSPNGDRTLTGSIETEILEWSPRADGNFREAVTKAIERCAVEQFEDLREGTVGSKKVDAAEILGALK